MRSFRTTSLGLPAAWLTIASWINAISMSFPTPDPEPEQLQMKKREIPVLRNYHGKAPASFWSAFPFRSLSNQAGTRVNVDSFREYVNMALPSWPFAKYIRGLTAIRQLSEGALPTLAHTLPPLFAPNIPSAYQYGSFITDNLVSWIKEGYVCGPFSEPTFPVLRVNPIQAVLQHDKVRPVLNLSFPPSQSFNDAIFQPSLIKPIMMSAQIFAYNLFLLWTPLCFFKI